MLLGHGHSQHKYPWYLSVSAQSFLTVKVSVRSSAEKTRDCAAGEKCVSDGCGRVCSPAPQASEAESPARIPQLHRRMLGPAQPSNCLTYTHPNSSNSYLILSSLSTYYPLRAKPLQSCPTLCDPMHCNLPGSSVRGILQARILERVAMPY